MFLLFYWDKYKNRRLYYIFIPISIKNPSDSAYWKIKVESGFPFLFILKKE